MRVMHLMRTYGVHGGERQLAQLFATPLPEAFVETFVFVYEDPACRNLFERISRLRLDRVWPFSLTPRPSLAGETLLVLFLLPLLQWRFIRLLRSGRFDICVVHGFQASVVAWLAASLIRSVRFVYVHRGSKSRLGRHPLFRILYRPFFAVAAVSNAAAQSLAPLVFGGEVHVLQNGLDWRPVVERAGMCRERSRSEIVLISVGRLIRGKGQGFLLIACKPFLLSNPGAQLWLVGEGPDRQALEREAAQSGIAHAVVFQGHSDDVACLLGRSNIFVYASQSEGLSNAVLEAMAAGLPSVVVDAPGVSECHVNNVTGVIVPRDHSMFALRLQELAGDMKQRRDMGAAASRRVQDVYSMEASRARYVELYQRLGAR